MAKVYLPLGSQTAHGKFLGIIVYKGTSVQLYDVPTDPRTDAQIDVRHFFADVTKVYRALGLWGRAAAKSSFGPRWFSLIYKRLAQDGRAIIAPWVVQWDALTEPQRQEWRDASPYVATWSDPGFIFYLCVWGLCTYFLATVSTTWELTLGMYGVYDGQADWWARDLSGVVGAGDSDQDTAGVVLDGDWEVLTDAGAWGGNYGRSISPTISHARFYFIGSAFQVFYVKDVGLGTMQILSDFDNVFISLLAVSPEFGNSWQSGAGEYGLHFVELNTNITGAQIAFDRLYITGKQPRRIVAEKFGTAEFIFPAGLVMPYAGPFAPAGWLTCDGRSLERTAYPTLFGVIDTLYGSADGTHFNLPDLRGRVVMGLGDGVGAGASGNGKPDGDPLTGRGLADWLGAEMHTLTVAEMPEHTHTQNAHTHTQNAHNHTQDPHRHTYGVNIAAGSNLGAPSAVATQTGVNTSLTTATNQPATAVNQDATAVNQNAGSGDGFEHITPALVLNYIIKT